VSTPRAPVSSDEPVLRFAGRVRVVASASGPLGLTLIGRVASGEVVHLALRCPPADLPAELEAPELWKCGAEGYRLSAVGRTLRLAPSAVFIHRDVGPAFYRAVPPHPVPWRKRLLWRALLGLIATPLGRWWLARRAARV
jgi:hypothetical protein